MKKVKKWLAWVLTGLMTVSMLPATAFAAGIENGQTTLTVNQSKVAFAGHEWWVIGDSTTGVYPKNGHITLLAANLDSDFQNVPFRRGQGSSGDGYTEYQGYYYANNPEGTNWTTPNEYAGSTMQQKMESIANSFSPKEQAVISARSLTGGGTYNSPSTDGIAGQGVANQKLWALSEAEWNTIGATSVRSYGDWWWLRSPYPHYGYASRVGYDSGDDVLSGLVDYGYDAARPALSLNLSSVLFTSVAAEGGKSSATVGSDLVGASAPTGTVKFTMVDDSQTLTVNATTAQSTQTNSTLDFSYSGATTGTNQYVSCVLTDNNGAVKYYGKLANSSIAESGALSIPLSDVANGTYTLKIFSEEANDNLYTDFCSEPVTMKVTVSGGSGTVSEFGGTIHDHNWSTEYGKDDTHHWHECTADNCPIADASQKDGYGEHSNWGYINNTGDTHTAKCSVCGYEAQSQNHTFDQEIANDDYLYSAATCQSPAIYHKSCVCGAKGTETFTSGTTDLTNHTGRVEWTEKTATTHTSKYSCCGAVVVNAASHDWVDGVCKDCGYVCRHSGGEATYFKLANCEYCGKPYGELTMDSTKPTGEIAIKENKWSSFLNTITFGLFFKETQEVTITGTDDSYSHDGFTDDKAVKIEYYLHSGDAALAEDDLKDETFTEYTEKFNINPDNRYVIYAKITDHAGNVAYISSDGLVLDSTTPVVNDLENGKTYCIEKTFTVDEAYISEVKDNETVITPDNEGIYTLGAGTHEITSTDKAGNVSDSITVTVNAGHTPEADDGDCTTAVKCSVCGEVTTAAQSHNFTDYKSNNDATCTQDGTKTAKCDNDGCAKTDTIADDGSALGHDYGEPVWNWSADGKTATAAFTCTRTGCTEEQEGHSVAETATVTSTMTTEPTCTEKGTTTYTARVTFDEQEYTASKDVSDIPKLGHDMGEWQTVTSPSCTDEGSQKRVCSRCDYSETQDLNPNGHEWATEFTEDKAATCTTDGSKSIHCKNCEATKDSTVISATGHSFKNGVCSVCGAAEPNYNPGTTEPTNPTEPSKPDDTSKPDDNKDNPDTGTNSPQTGDTSNMALWFVLMGVSAAGLGGALLLQKRRRSRAK